MKRNWKKSLLAIGLAGVMLGSVACGNEVDESQGSQVVNSQENAGSQATDPGQNAGGNQGTTDNSQSGSQSATDGNQSGNNQVSGDQAAELTTGPAVGTDPLEEKVAHVSVHDPSIFREVNENGEVVYYVYGTHITSAKSDDLVNWKVFTNGYAKKNNTLYGDLSANLAGSFAWAGENDSDCKGGFAVWAPDIVYNERYVNEDGSLGAYMIYYSASSTYCRSAIGYAVADTVEGPFTYKGTLVYSGFTQKSAKDKNSEKDKIWTNTNIDELMAEGRIEGEFNTKWANGGYAYNTDYAPNAIDPTIFTDTEGRMWMCYGSWSGGIYLLEIDPATGDAIYPGKDGTTEDGRVIDKYFGTRIACGHTKSGEGPYILYDEETKYYYLYVTYNFLDSVSGYNMRLFRSEKPEGPYLDAAGNNAVFESKGANQYAKGIKVMGNYVFSNCSMGYRSPGHNSAFIDEDGQRYLIYHTRFANRGEHFEVRVHQQFMNEDGWPVTAVFENRNDEISTTGYAQDEIVGLYEFINHGTASDGSKVREPEAVILEADGTIGGDYTGTWVQKDGSYLATFEIDGVTYKGVFFAQHDEMKTSTKIMTFTAIGSNNETIMGVKCADGREYVATEKEVKDSGKPASNLEAIEKTPVVKLTFEDATGVELKGDAKVENGVLTLAKDASGTGKTYAVLPDLTGYDFSNGITLSADVLVSDYATDWTAIFMMGDGTIGGGCKTYGYHFTQGFSSVTDDAQNQKVGYYGADIKQPYTWDYFGYEPAQDVWHTVTVTITATEMKTYINGVQVQSAKADYSMIMDTFKVASGNYLGGSYYPDPDFSGQMDNVAIYDSCLSKEEVAKIAGK